MRTIPFGAPRRWIGFFILLLATSQAIGQVIYYHNFGTTNITSHPYTVAATMLDSHLSGSSWSNSVGVWTSGNGATGEAIRLQGAVTATVTLTFNVAANYKVDIDSFSFWRQRSNTGWSAWSMTINGINVGSGTNVTAGASTGTVSVANPVAGLTGMVTVVISLSGQTGNGTLRIDDFTLNGSVTPNCTAATITNVSPTTGPEHTLVTLTGSGFLSGSGTSAVKFNGTASVFTVVSDTEIRAYVPAGQVSGPITVVTNGCDGTPAQTFTSVVSAVGVAYSSDIYITEIYDAQVGDGGIIEIYNGTAAAVDLSGYTIRRYGDIGDTSSFYTVPLTGIIPPGGIFLLGIGNGPLPCPVAENMHYATGFNQNDEFELIHNGTVIDNVYAPVAGVGYSVIRNPDAVAPKPEFDPVDWTTYTTEDCADIGSFTPTTIAPPTVSSVNSQITCEQGSVTFSAALSNPVGYTFQWKMLNASGVWVNVPTAAPYSGANTSSLTINPSPLSLDNGQFYCAYTSSSTGTTLVSNAAQLDVNPATLVPTFNQIAPICQGDPLGTLPTTSNNGITGSWSPAPNNTATTIYTFTPTTGQCASTTTMTITVTPGVTPTFTQVPPICQGDPLGTLPTTSNNGITGSWSPAPNNTATTTYTFTPTTGQCASTATMTITVTPGVTPTFTPIAPICQGDSLGTLPTTSNNGITGSWSPAPNNTATTTYTFTPTTGQCASTTTMTITVTLGVTPTFTQIPPICQGDPLGTLPTTSNNGIVGSWSPAPNNTATTTYTFIPTTGQCASTTTMTITVTNGIVPTFASIGPICYRESLSLPERSLEGISGTWSPAPDNEATTTYTFTPDNGQCATATTLTVTVIDQLPIALGGPYYLCVDNNDGTVISTIALESSYDASQFTIDWYKDGQLLPGHDSELVVWEPGTYKLTVTDPVSGCMRSALTQVYTSSIAIASATVGRDFNDTQFIEITVTGGSGDYEYLLEGGNAQDSNIFSNIYEGEYEVSVRDKHGCGNVTLLVYALNYPRYFTPNGDGIHDVWTINGLRNQTGCQIYIFDRYGKLLAATRPAHDNGWDGTYNGHSMPADDYWFTCDYLDRSGQPQQLKAHFALKR